MNENVVKVYCALCARESREVWRMIKADGASICDICVDIATSILIDERAKEREAAQTKETRT